MFKLVKKQKTMPISLREHFLRRNKVLIRRRAGGFGDIFMQRMMFEDFKKTGLNFTHACPHPYNKVAENHPFVESVVISDINERDYGAIYDITTVCRAYESCHAPASKHRSDIWAEHCGITLENHNMFIIPDETALSKVRSYINYWNPGKLPVILMATSSSLSEDDFGKGKSLTDEQITLLVNQARSMGLLPIAVHHQHQPIYENLQVNQLILPIQEWIASISLGDYILSIDSATFHLAGGLKRPLIGIFTFTDGKVYGQYYDFVLVQKHRDNGNWDCGPCFLSNLCPKERCSPLKPCLTELTADELTQGLIEALKRWPVTRTA